MTRTIESVPAADPIDIHVGARLRLQRKHRAMSQTALADALGLTFQQVQKYERGTNRVSASMLLKAARALNVPFDYFVEGLDRPGIDAQSDPVAMAAATDGQVRELIKAFTMLDHNVRVSTCALVTCLAKNT